ncbi:MAG: hypothetical protein ACQ5SW_03540 [Sphaerochaetaceae bacterium]
MKYIVLGILLTIQLCISCGCDQQGPSVIDLFGAVDYTPPTLLKITSLDRYTALLTFSEPISEDMLYLAADGNIIQKWEVNKTSLIITFGESMALREGMPLDGRVEDLRGNSSSFSVLLWAKNPNPPSLLINEFTTKGSENNPDRVELLVISRGNLGGITLYAGTEQAYSDRCIFPEIWVERGTYIVIVFSKGTISEKAYYAEKCEGLSGNNGCLTLALAPQWDAELLDAVVWGNQTTQTHEGFGSKTLMEQVQRIAEKGHWNSNVADLSINSTYSTATRSMCRESQKDTNSMDDWYVCAARNASFGKKNSEEHYQE